MTVYTPDQWQEAIVALANAGAGGTPADTYQSGNLTAAQPTVGTPVAGGTVTIALGEGQAVVDAALTGTFNAGTTVLFEGTEDVGVTSNWFPMFGQDTSVANPPNISSIAGGASKLIRIPAMGYAQVRVRANPFAGGDNVAVRMGASVAGSGMAGALSTNDGTFAKETGGVLGATTDVAVTGDTAGSLSAKLRGWSKMLFDVWDSVNHLFHINNKQIGGTAISVNAGTVDAGTQRVSLATDQKVPTKAASGDFATGAIVDLPAKGTAVMTGATPVTIATDDTQITAVKNSVAAIPAKGTAVMTGSSPVTIATDDTQMTAIKNSVANIPAKGAAATSASTPVNVASDQVVPMKRSAVAAYSLASTTTSGSTQNSGDITVGLYTEISLDINTTAQAGTNPTLQLFYERKGADAIYYVLWQSAVLTAAANTLSTSIGAGMAYNQSLGSTGRVRWVVGGTATPTFTMSINLTGK